ncbi:MAG: hypothetical protein JSS53_03575 [Proteobacteria bacterium]|nr:hypothetical protein [Pseudomonadota bacterium]
MKTKLIVTGLSLLLVSSLSFADFIPGNPQPLTEMQKQQRENAYLRAINTDCHFSGRVYVKVRHHHHTHWVYSRAYKAYKRCLAYSMERSGAWPSGSVIRVLYTGQCLKTSYPWLATTPPAKIYCHNYTITGVPGTVSQCFR